MSNKITDFFQNAFEEAGNIHKANSRQIQYKWHKRGNNRTVHFVWFEENSWLIASTAPLFTAFDIQNRHSMIMDLKHLKHN